MANPTAQVPMATTPFGEDRTKRDLAATVQTYYPGEAIGIDSSGNATKCDDAAVLIFDGVVSNSPRIEVQTGDSAGDKKVDTERPRYATFKTSGAAATDIGRPCWFAFSNEVQFVPGTNKNFCGYVHRFISATEVEVELMSRMGPELVSISAMYNVP